jgi:glycosyltransferase involved in cell wall biosynthesis
VDACRILTITSSSWRAYNPAQLVLESSGFVFEHLFLEDLRSGTRGRFGSRKLAVYTSKEPVMRIRETVDRFRPDIIHLSPGRASTLSTLRAMAGNRKTPILLEHGAIDGLNILNPIDHATFFNRRIAKLIVPTRAVVNSWLRRPGFQRLIGPDRCAVLPIPVEVPEPISQERKLAIRRELGLPESGFIVGTVCTVRAIKNLPFVAKVISKMPFSPLFAVVGSGKESELRQLREAGGQSVRLLGRIPDAWKMMGAFDLFVTPTRLPGESFGIAPAEAMSQGVPVLTMNFGGTAEIIEHGVSGLALPMDHAAWALAILDLAQDAQRLGAMGEAARERISRHFSAKVVARDLQQLYRSQIPADGHASVVDPA